MQDSDLWQRLQSVALEFVQVGRDEEKARWRAGLESAAQEARDLAQQLGQEQERARLLEEDRDRHRDASSEATKLAFDNSRQAADENDMMQRIVLAFKFREAGFLGSMLEACAHGDIGLVRNALDAWCVPMVEEAAVASALDQMLHQAAMAGQLDICRLLLAWAADPAAREACTGQNALHAAASAAGADDTLVEELLSELAPDQVDDVDLQACTPLMLASVHAKELRVKALLRAGADPCLENHAGLAAHDLAPDGPRGDLVRAALTSGPELLQSATERAIRLTNAGGFEAAHRVCVQALAALDAANAVASQDAWAPSPSQVAELCMHAALAANKLGKFCDAADVCTRALLADPDSIPALYIRAESSMRVYDYAKAAQDYSALCRLDGDRAWKPHLIRANELVRKMSDHYLVLGLAPSCAAGDVRRAFLQKCLRWHPDKNRSSREAQTQASILIQAVNEANAVLSDPARRQAYDQEQQHKPSSAASSSLVFGPGTSSSARTRAYQSAFDVNASFSPMRKRMPTPGNSGGASAGGGQQQPRQQQQPHLSRSAGGPGD